MLIIPAADNGGCVPGLLMVQPRIASMEPFVSRRWSMPSFPPTINICFNHCVGGSADPHNRGCRPIREWSFRLQSADEEDYSGVLNNTWRPCSSFQPRDGDLRLGTVAMPLQIPQRPGSDSFIGRLQSKATKRLRQLRLSDILDTEGRRRVGFCILIRLLCLVMFAE